MKLSQRWITVSKKVFLFLLGLQTSAEGLDGGLYIVWIVLMSLKLMFYSHTNNVIFQTNHIISIIKIRCPTPSTPLPPSENYLIGYKN